MSYQQAARQPQCPSSSPGRSSPLRYTASNASTNSSAYSSSSNPFLPSRTSTMSSTASSVNQNFGAGHKRGISETSPTRPSMREGIKQAELTAGGGYKSVRQSLRPLPQAPNSSPPAPLLKPYQSHLYAPGPTEPPKYHYEGPAYSSPAAASQIGRANATMLGRSGSVTPMTSGAQRHKHTSSSPHGPNLTSPELTNLKSSSTNHLRTLSKFAQNGSSEEFPITSPAVAGLSGRSARGSAWSESNWMEKQRQFLQAYEYLCHIGEAKEWIEDIIHQQLPPILQLEEALRDGVTLAEIVQAFYPDQSIRIFRHPKLQFRHSDNIAMFFNFLADM